MPRYHVHPSVLAPHVIVGHIGMVKRDVGADVRRGERNVTDSKPRVASEHPRVLDDATPVEPMKRP